MRLFLALLFWTTTLQCAGILLPYAVSPFAGGNFVGDGGLATASPLRDAEGICVDSAGNIYVGDAGDNRVRMISANGTISTAAGTGSAGPLTLPYGVAADAARNLYIADLGNNRIRKIAPDGTATTLLDKLASPRNLIIDAAGNIYFSEFAGHRVRKIAPDGTVSIIAGTGAAGADGDGGPAALAKLTYPAGLALDASGALYIADSGNQKIRKVSGGKISTVLGTGVAGNASASQLSTPTAVAIDSAGTLYVADAGNHRIRKLTLNGVISTIPANVRDIALETSGNLVAVNGEHAYRILPSGVVTLIAGDGSYLFRGDGGPATQARLNSPSGVALDAQGNLWISDTANLRIRMVNTSGQINTVAGGTGQFTSPLGIALDAAGNLLIADPAAYRVAELPATYSTISTVAGNGVAGMGIDGISSTSSSLLAPNGVAAIAGGGFYIADTGNNRIRRVNSSGIVASAAGNGNAGFNGDGAGQASQLRAPAAICVDVAGNVYIADTLNNRIRLLTLDGQLATIAGPDQLNQPRGVAVDSSGNVWIADTGNHRVVVLPPGGVLTVVTAQLQTPVGLAVDNRTGAIYVADQGSNTVMLLSPPPPALTEAPPSLPVVNAATLLTGPVAPGSLISIFGTGLALAQPFFDGQPVMALLTQDSQINVQVPLTATGAFEIRSGAVSLLKITLSIVPAAPGIFTGPGGTGPAIAANPDGSINSSANPAGAGDILTFYATGAGQGNAIFVTVGGASATVLYGGDAPGMPGLTQVNAQLPSGVSSGAQPLILWAGASASQAGVTLAIR